MGWNWKMAWAFCVGRNRNRGIGIGREAHEGRKELRYDTRGSESESEWHEWTQSTLPYLTLPFTHAFSTVCRRVTFRLLFATSCYSLPCTAPQEPFLPPGMTVGDYRSSALYIWSSTAPGGGFFCLFWRSERAGRRDMYCKRWRWGQHMQQKSTCRMQQKTGGTLCYVLCVGTVDTLCIFVPVSADDY